MGNHPQWKYPSTLANVKRGYGVRFSFVQEYFNLLCSDLSSFPVARAVTASSAVPVLFNPVVVENYRACKETKPEWLAEVEKTASGSPELELIAAGRELLRSNPDFLQFLSDLGTH